MRIMIRSIITVITLAFAVQVHAKWEAYHDLGAITGQESTGNITTHQSGPSGQGANPLDTGVKSLIKYSDGTDTGVDLTIAGASGMDSRTGVTAPPAAGTPAAKLFNIAGLNLTNGIIYKSAGTITITLSGLNPDKVYDLALYGNQTLSADGVQRFTMTNAVSAVNSSSTGIQSTFVTDMQTRPNDVAGNVVRWTYINPGSNGTLAVVIDPSVTSSANVAYLSAVRLAERDPVVELPAWSGSEDPSFTEITFGTKATEYRNRQTFYSSEWLPAIFRRTLTMETALGPTNKLTWRFTGPKAGVTIAVSGQQLTIRPRYYDTSAYNEIQGKVTRHPEWGISKKWDLKGPLQAITVQMDQGMNLYVSLNGTPVFERKWDHDLTQHQISLDRGGQFTVNLLRPGAVKTMVTVNPSKRHQSMIGFGGITTPTAYTELSPEGKRQWWRLVSDYNLLIQREFPNGARLNPAMDNWDVLSDANPHHYASNFPNGEISDFTYNKMIYALGGKVWFEFWSLPPWVNKNADKYAEAMVNYCQTSLKKAGRPPQVVGIQNETKHHATRLHDMVLALRSKLDEAGFKEVQIHSSNQPYLMDGIEELKKYKADPEIWRRTDYVASNVYDFQKHFYNLDGFDEKLHEWRDLTAPKPFLAVEICIQKPEGQLPSYRPALIMAQLYHKLLTITDASALAYCWTLLNIVEPSFGWSRSLCVVDRENGFVPSAVHQLRAFGAYSRRVKEGMTRVEVTSSNPDVLACAFTGEGGKVTLIALNRSLSPIELQVNGLQAAFVTLERVNPYSPNQPEPYTGGALKIAPGEIVTLTNVDLNVLPANFLKEYGL